jgi:hypothetical protein
MVLTDSSHAYCFHIDPKVHKINLNLLKASQSDANPLSLKKSSNMGAHKLLPTLNLMQKSGLLPHLEVQGSGQYVKIIRSRLMQVCSKF